MFNFQGPGGGPLFIFKAAVVDQGVKLQLVSQLSYGECKINHVVYSCL